MCEPKGKDIFRVDNFTNFIIVSNRDWVVPAGLDDRRFLVIDVSEKHKDDKKHFAPIYDQMDNGGVEALLYDLLRRDVSNFFSKPIPQTEAIFDQKLRTSPPIVIFWYERLREGTTLNPARIWVKRTGVSTIQLTDCKYADSGRIKQYQRKWIQQVITGIFYTEFQMFMKEIGRSNYKLDRGTFVKELRKCCPSIGKGKRIILEYKGPKAYALTMPPLKVCRSEFEKRFGIKKNW